MSGTGRLAAYAAAIGLMFGGGAALGSAVGPDPSPTPSTAAVEHDRVTDDQTHESDH